MATVIDSLVVLLGLDITDYKKSQNELAVYTKKTKEELNKHAKDVQEANKKTSESFNAIKAEALGLFSVLIGAGSFAEFTGNTIKSAIAVDMAAQSMGIATNEAKAFGAVIEANSGKASEAIGSLQSLTQMLQIWNTFGQIDLGKLGVLQVIGATDQNETALDIYKKFAAWAKDKPGPKVQTEGHLLGLDDGSINEAMKGDAQYAKEFADALQRVGQDESAYQNLRRLNSEWKQLSQSIQNAGMSMLNWLSAPTADALHNLNNRNNPQSAAAGAALRGDFGSWWSNAAKTHFLGDFDIFGKTGGAATGGGGGGGGGGAATGGGGSQAYQIALAMKRAGISDPVIVGVLRGIAAEGGEFGITDQVDAHGNAAHGIGQWRGDRWKAITKKYGLHPTPQQEIQALIDELKGGDRGGAAVLGAGSSDAAARAYIEQFMRPGSGTGGDLARAGLWGGSLNGASYGGGSTTIHVDKIEITTKSADAKGIAREVRAVLNTRALTGMANQGLV